MDVLFTRISVPGLKFSSGPLTRPNTYVANPKAVAAQTLKAKDVEVPFHDSKVWSMLGRFFSTQFAVPMETTPVIDLPTKKGGWIIYPIALVDFELERGCAVWLEGRKVRHVRLYQSECTAAADNAEIREIIGNGLAG